MHTERASHHARTTAANPPIGVRLTRPRPQLTFSESRTLANPSPMLFPPNAHRMFTERSSNAHREGFPPHPDHRSPPTYWHQTHTTEAIANVFGKWNIGKSKCNVIPAQWHRWDTENRLHRRHHPVPIFSHFPIFSAPGHPDGRPPDGPPDRPSPVGPMVAPVANAPPTPSQWCGGNGGEALAKPWLLVGSQAPPP